MSGDWIKMQANLPDKPEVWQIAGILGIDADSVVGKLLRVWAWFDAHTENGNASGVTFALVDRITSVTGFAEALLLSGWLEQNGSELCIPNFVRHNGKTAKNRALTNERVAKNRASGNAARNAASVTKTVTREEKRREEENTPPTPKGEPDGFTTFWDEWPKSDRKGSRVKCLDAWRKAKCEGEAMVILAHVQRLKTSDDWKRENGRFIPAPLVYLNQRRWDGASDGGSPQGGLNLIGAI